MRMHDNGSDAWNVSQVGQVTRESGPGHCDALQIKVSLISTGSVYVFNSTRNLHELWEREQEHRMLQSCIVLINYKPLCHVSFPSKAAGNRHFFFCSSLCFQVVCNKTDTWNLHDADATNIEVLLLYEQVSGSNSSPGIFYFEYLSVFASISR